MAVEFVETSVLDLVHSTEFLHRIKPSLTDKFVFGIEKAKPDDRSIVFHMIDRHREKTIIILSAQYMLEHEYWKKEERENE